MSRQTASRLPADLRCFLFASTLALPCVWGACPAPECYTDLDCADDQVCGDERTCEAQGAGADDAGVAEDDGADAGT